MGNLLGGSSGGSFGGYAGGYGYGPELQCCDAVVDPLSLLAALGSIAALALFLRQAVIDNMITGGKKRSNDGTIAEQIKEVLFKGRSPKILPAYNQNYLCT